MNLAICVPTFNRSDIVDELIKRCIGDFVENEIDLYICDSSNDTKTEVICENYCKKYSNITYVKYPSDIHSNAKVYKIYQDLSKIDKYDYIWLCSDSIRYSSRVIGLVVQTLKMKSYDMMVIEHRPIDHIQQAEYHDCNEVFLNCACSMTLYGATIINMRKFFGDIDWSYYESRYLYPDCINFSHLIMYFEQLSNIDSFSVKHVRIPFFDFAPSPLKLKSGWYENTFDVWCKCWLSSIKKLPSIYSESNKKIVVKKHGDYSDVLSKKTMYCLKKDGVYNLKAYFKYFFYWNKVTSISHFELFKILMLSKKRVKLICDSQLEISHMGDKLEYFKERFSKRYIYGCGYMAANLGEYFDENNIHYDGFVVTNISTEKDSLREKKIYQINDDMLFDERIGFFVATNVKANAEIMKYLEERGCSSRVVSLMDEIRRMQGLDIIR